MRHSHRIFSPEGPPVHITPMERLHDSAVAAGLSNGARNLLVKIVLWSGHRGYCWWPIPKIAKIFTRSESAVRRWIRELEYAELLRVVPDPGRSSFLVPYPAEFRGPLSKMKGVVKPAKPIPRRVEVGFFDPGKEKVQNQSTLVVETSEDNRACAENPQQNVFGNELQKQPEDPHVHVIQVNEATPSRKNQRPAQKSLPRDVGHIVGHIEEVTKDTHSRGAFIRIAREVPEQVVYYALSILRCAMESGTVHNPGAYFVSTVKALSTVTFAKTTTAPATQPDTPWMTLPMIETAYPHLKVRVLWGRYQELKAGSDLDQFRLFLQANGRRIWEEKPHYRRME